MDTAIACMRGMGDCIAGSKEMGMICAKGVYQKGEVLDTLYMQQAYEMGKNVDTPFSGCSLQNEEDGTIQLGLDSCGD